MVTFRIGPMGGEVSRYVIYFATEISGYVIYSATEISGYVIYFRVEIGCHVIDLLIKRANLHVNQFELLIHLLAHVPDFMTQAFMTFEDQFKFLFYVFKKNLNIFLLHYPPRVSVRHPTSVHYSTKHP